MYEQLLRLGVTPVSSMAKTSLFACSLACALVPAISVAQESESPYHHQTKLIRAPQAFARLGDDLFGDKVNLYTGSLEFIQNDVSLPGNSALPVSVGRHLVVGQKPVKGSLFGGWDLEIPHLHGIFSKDGWKSGPGAADFNRCSSFSEPPGKNWNGADWDGTEYWQGSFLYVPGQGDQEMLRRAGWFTLAPGGAPQNAYPIVTRNKWTFRCLPALKNGARGEGFVAVSPDGTEYRFDWLVQRETLELKKATPGPANDSRTGLHTLGEKTAGYNDDGLSNRAVAKPRYSTFYILPRVEVWILPTVITDRHGNTVTYTYDQQNNWQLQTIVGSESSGSSRTLTLSYTTPGSTTSNLVSSVTDGVRTWYYAYDSISLNAALQTVTLPDGSSWQLNGIQSLLQNIDYAGSGSCEGGGAIISQALSGTITHPSGAVGDFTLTPLRHGRDNVDHMLCNDAYHEAPYYPLYFDTYALTAKTIRGPGLPDMTWRTAYPNPPVASWAPCSGCAGKKMVVVTDPDGNQTRYTFGTLFRQTEGQLQQTEVWDKSGTWLRTTYLVYTDAVQPFGQSLQRRGDGDMAARTSEVFRRQTDLLGASFVWYADVFDPSFGMPTHVVKISNLGWERDETAQYDNNLAKWAIGRVAKITEDKSKKVLVENRYDQSTGDLLSRWKFGQPQAERTFTYNPDGTIKTSTDGLNQTTTFTNYKRGIPRTVVYQDNSWESAEVDDLGLIRSLTRPINAAGDTATTGFHYDGMGRLDQITQPAGDIVNWNPTTIEFKQIWDQEYDLAPGHWRQIVLTGAGIDVTYLDALLRPVYTDRWDQADRANTERFVKHQYDFAGRTTFASYPARSYGDVSGGVYQAYDALGRPTVRATTTELGTLYDGFSYGAQFQKTYTDAKENNITYTYQAFDEPSEDAIRTITYPEGVSVDIQRDVFGKPLSITRFGNGKSVTRSYVYDQYERLCKTVEPETKATIQDYDGANNVAWRATGLKLTSTTSCDNGGTSVPETAKVRYYYDERNRLKTTTYGDGSPAITRTYTPDGLLDTVTSNGAAWKNDYNRRRLIQGETLTYAGVMYHIGRDYDANGSLTQLTYPDDSTVTYSPDAFGEPTQVGKYALRINHYPNGAVKGFVYGNGIAHAMYQNVRGLPEWSIDEFVLRDNYAYDKNGNVAQILDGQEGVYNRNMYYDGLNRLQLARAPSLWGDAWYGYDALDNLVSMQLTAGANTRATTNTFDPVTNLVNGVSNNVAGPKYNLRYQYDDRGNLALRGSQAFTFDLGNRMTSATGKATYAYDGLGHRFSIIGNDGVNRIQVYSQEGQLLYATTTSQPAKTGTKYIYLHNHLIAEVKR